MKLGSFPHESGSFRFSLQQLPDAKRNKRLQAQKCKVLRTELFTFFLQAGDEFTLVRLLYLHWSVERNLLHLGTQNTKCG